MCVCECVCVCVCELVDYLYVCSFRVSSEGFLCKYMVIYIWVGVYVPYVQSQVGT